MKTKIIIGIDPGQKGGIAYSVLNDTNLLFIGNLQPQQFSLALHFIKAYFHPCDITVCIEKQWSRPYQDVKTMDKLMCNFCMVQGIALAWDVPCVIVAPTTWKAEVLGNKSATKEDAVRFANSKYKQKLRPSQDGIADAICIMHYGVLHANIIQKERI